jgi:hypothetical protein
LSEYGFRRSIVDGASGGIVRYRSGSTCHIEVNKRVSRNKPLRYQMNASTGEEDGFCCFLHGTRWRIKKSHCAGTETFSSNDRPSPSTSDNKELLVEAVGIWQAVYELATNV